MCVCVCVSLGRGLSRLLDRDRIDEMSIRSAKLIFQGLNLGRALPASGESVVDPDPGRDRQHYADDKIIRPLQLRYLVASLALLLKSNRFLFFFLPFFFFFSLTLTITRYSLAYKIFSLSPLAIGSVSRIIIIFETR